MSPTTFTTALSLLAALAIPASATTVRPQDDLFLAANGPWLTKTVIPADKSYVLGVEVNDITDARIHAIVQALARTRQRLGSIEQQVGAFYASYTDTAAIDRAGMAPVKAALRGIDAINSRAALAAHLGKSQGVIDTPLWLRVFPDLKDPDISRVMMWQGGLGLPDREYYLAHGDARFAFRGVALGGAKAPEPRWQQGIAVLNSALGEAVGQLYVRRHFQPGHKQQVQAMVDNVMAAYRESIQQTTRMTAATKQQALDKLARYRTKIGYPSVWRDYGKLEVRGGDALGNKVRAARFNWQLQAAKADRPVDRDAWHFTPQTADAMYDPMLNEIVFPAAVLQPPFFDPAADDALNYGAIGANIAHEITHGFDQMGSQFDGEEGLREEVAQQCGGAAAGRALLPRQPPVRGEPAGDTLH